MPTKHYPELGLSAVVIYLHLNLKGTNPLIGKEMLGLFVSNSFDPLCVNFSQTSFIGNPVNVESFSSQCHSYRVRRLPPASHTWGANTEYKKTALFSGTFKCFWACLFVSKAFATSISKRRWHIMINSNAPHSLPYILIKNEEVTGAFWTLRLSVGTPVPCRASCWSWQKSCINFF